MISCTNESHCRPIAFKFETFNDIIISKDSLFINALWSKLCYHFKMKQCLGIVFRLQINEQTEYQNQILKHYLRMYCFKKQDDWTNLLFIIEFIYHQMKHASLNCNSVMIMYDYEITFDICIKNNAMKREVSIAKEYVEMLYELWNMLTQWWQSVFET